MRRLTSIFTLILTCAALFIGGANVRPVRADEMGPARYVASNGNDGSDCRSSALPCRTIQYALDIANSVDTILVAQGTYTYDPAVNSCTFLPQNGKSVVCIVDKILSIFGGYSTSNWTTAHPAANLTVIDGQNAYRGVFLIGNNSTTVSLDMEGITIQNGRTQGPFIPGDPSGFGGGMVVSGARVTLRDMVFKNNKVYGYNMGSGAGGAAAGAGLAINWSQPGTSNLLERVTFDNNQSFGSAGTDRGGLAYGALFVSGSVTVDYGTFTNNRAFAGSSSGIGTSGGLYGDALGGAMGGGRGAWVLRHIVATGNQAIGGNNATIPGGAFGGGIYAEDATSVTISDSTLSNNVATGGNAKNGGFGAGGGIMMYNSPVVMDRVRLVANSAIGGNSTGGGNAGPGGGGGLYLWRSLVNLNSNATVTNAIIADNYVTMGTVGGTVLGGGGGGIQVQGLQATITHSTIARNRLGPALVSGQGLLVLTAPGVSASTVNVNQSIISNHTEGGAGAVAVLVQQGNTVNFNRGLFAGNTKNTNSDGSPMSAGAINGAMLSAPSAGYVSPGSPNFNYHLRLDSAAKDQATGSVTADDVDGQTRPYNAVSDLGADEYQPFLLFAVSGDGTLRLNWTAGASVITGGVNHYEIIVTCAAGAKPPDQGNCGQPINAGTATTFMLTGLSNYKQYSMVVNARDASQILIATSTTTSTFPSDLFLYLPLLVR